MADLSDYRVFVIEPTRSRMAGHRLRSFGSESTLQWRSLIQCENTLYHLRLARTVRRRYVYYKWPLANWPLLRRWSTLTHLLVVRLALLLSPLFRRWLRSYIYWSCSDNLIFPCIISKNKNLRGSSVMYHFVYATLCFSSRIHALFSRTLELRRKIFFSLSGN